MTGCADCSGCLDRAHLATAGPVTASPGPCGGGSCCAGVHPVTPRAGYNRPGLAAIDYRVGTHHDLLESMIARLASRPELAGYTTRAPDDPGIALLDSWALTGDIVTFYTERAANEGYLGTATQPDSLALLGRLVDYQPRPAVGASGYLAFTMDPGAAGVIAAGSQARSVAGPNELPQTFETSETLQARADWNQLAVRLTRPPALSPGTADGYNQITLVGASLGVQAGTRLVFDFGSAAGPIVRVVTTVTPDFAAGRTVVDLAPLGPLGVDEALQQLTELVDNASSDLPPPGPIAQGVYTILTAFRDAANAENADVFTAVADLVRQVTEALAIAANRVPPGVVSWLAGSVTRVLDQARTTLSLMSQDERRLAPDIDYLQRLARALTCTPAELRRDPAACDRAAPLMTAAAILPALRRPPSQPPVTSAALPQAASAALDPQSSAVTAILAAADPRLAGVLGQAVGQQTATAPPATASVIALKTKANPLAEGDNADPTRLLLDGTADSLVPRSWVVSEENSWDGTTWTTQAYANRIVSARQFTRQVQLSSAGPTTNVPTTEVTLDGDAYAVNGGEPTDQLTVYYGGAPVPLADETITDDVGGAEIELARTYDGLRPGPAAADHGRAYRHPRDARDHRDRADDGRRRRPAPRPSEAGRRHAAGAGARDPARVHLQARDRHDQRQRRRRDPG